MNTNQFFADTMTVNIIGGNTTYTVGTLKNTELNAKWDLKPLYGIGSIKRQAIAKKDLVVDVRCKYAKFDGQLIGAIMGNNTTADQDASGGASSGRTRYQITDTTTVQTFTLQGTVTAKNGSTTFDAYVTEVAFEGIPIVWPEGEWQNFDLVGQGDDLAISTDS